jgi:glycosyltransferase involved in cell wall biosynthesis
MRIAIIGTRGVPARYGGFETFADKISSRLADHGHEVAVYCRRSFTSPKDTFDSRVRRIILPSIHTKYLDTLSHTFLSILHVLFTDAEVVLLCNVANSPFAWIPRVFGKPVILNVDGLDRKRKKWNWLGRLYLLACEILSVVTPTKLVTDAETIKNYFWKKYRKRSEMIAYGAEAPPGIAGLDGFRLAPQQYLLYVSRLEPENNPDMVIRAFGKIETDWPLVLVGGNPYNEPYVRHLKSIADPRVIFTGPVYGERYWQLQKNAALYVCASEIGGTHPGLIEAMAAQNAVLYCNTPENREVVGECGIPFELQVEDLAKKMGYALQDTELRTTLGAQSQKRVETIYGWERIAAQYENLMHQALSPAFPRLHPKTPLCGESFQDKRENY